MHSGCIKRILSPALLACLAADVIRAEQIHPGARTQPAGIIQIKPGAITLKSVPRVSTERGCVLRCRGGMNILSVESSDPAIAASWRKGAGEDTVVVTAMLPAGYSHPGKDHEEILVRTDVPEEPVVRIPLRVWSGPLGLDEGWLNVARTWIGQPPPSIVAYDREGERFEIHAQPGEVTAIVFSAHWCEHCDEQMPRIAALSKEFAGRGVRFYDINRADGNGVGIAKAIERWGLDWTVGLDRGSLLAGQFGIVAYPLIVLVGRDGNIEAVHGRHNNNGQRNGLDHIDTELRQELNVLLAGGTRADFPTAKPAALTRPAAVPATLPAVKQAAARGPVNRSAAAVPATRPTAG